MSVLVWDGVTLAADRAANDGQTKMSVVKLWCASDKLIGGVGNMHTVHRLRDWIIDGRNLEDFPSDSNSLGTHVVVVTKDKGLVRYLPDNPYGIEHGFNAIALGTGRDFAYGALAMGATAEQAVEIANKYSTTCGLGVQAVRL